MQWCSLKTKAGPVDKYAVVSQCGTFTIARIVLNGVDTYELWKGREFVSRHTSPDEARSAVNVTRTEMAVNAR